MTKAEIVAAIKEKETFLCIGLDPELDKIPSHLLKEKDPILAFNKQLIEATHDLCVAYKPNSAFYECLGLSAWETLQRTKNHIPAGIFTIIDAKRGDIGNTAKMYAQAFLENMGFDAITIAPYMGKDSITPFLENEQKWGIILGLTSNEGSMDFQKVEDREGKKLFEHVISKSAKWGTANNLMYVVGATRSEDIASIRKLIPDHFMLVPGVGAQGGSLDEVCIFGLNKEIGLLINSSRAIIYASKDHDFAQAARREALKMKEAMKPYLDRLGSI